jgi:hypothetical protein
MSGTSKRAGDAVHVPAPAREVSPMQSRAYRRAA